METRIIRVRDVMRTDIDIVDGSLTVAEVLGCMDTLSSRAVVVDKRDENDEYGFVLLEDIARKVLAKDRSPERVNIYEIMTKPALSVRSEMNIRYCARLFDKFGIRRAPVIDDGRVSGIVSYNDMVLKGLKESLKLG